MKVREFLEAVRERLPALLPPPHAAFEWRIAFGYLQVWYGDPRLHFECWVQRRTGPSTSLRTGLLEIGLHFEGQRDFSYAWAAALADRMPEAMAALGDGIELEEWTPRWARLHETRRVETLNEALAGEAAARLAAYVIALRPLLDEIAPSIPESSLAPSPSPRPARPRRRPRTPRS